MSKVDAKKDEDFDDDSISSSDSEDDGRPPPMIQIERSADLGALKSALFNKEKENKEKEPKQIEERLGKDVLSNITSNFEKPQEGAQKQEKEKIVLENKEQYSSFKKKFENLNEELAKQDEERRVQALKEKEVEGIGAEILSAAKTMFEKGQNENGGRPAEKIEIERSEEAKKRVKETFFEDPNKEEPKECAVCGKMVYPVEKVLANKRVYHKACFKCHTCQKTLSVQNYSFHEGKLYCKLHIMEIYRPEVGLAHTHEGAMDVDMGEPDDDEEYAIVAKPKQLDPSVVRSGLKTTDDLENVPKLQNAKQKWAESAEQSGKAEKKSGVEADLIQQGKVKSRLTKFVEGGEPMDEEPDDDEDEASRDPNIIRSTKKKEAIQIETGAKTIKSKWESGTVEKAQAESQDRSSELDEIKKNVSVKERFKERTGQEGDDADAAQRRSAILAEEPIDTSFTKSAKERFQKGEAFQDTNPVEKTAMDDIKFTELGSFKKKFETGEALDEHATEKTAVDVRCAELGNIKAAFEQQGKTEDQTTAEMKKKQIQDEFNRIKEERKAMRQAAPGEEIEEQDEADAATIKKRFEEGKAFQSTVEKKSGEQLEIKVAGKAREKFKQIDQEAPKEPVIDKSSKHEPSKWDKEKGAAPEPINRRADADVSDEEPEEYEVKDLLNKFKNIAEKKSEVKKDAMTADELAAIRVEAKNLKEKFEKVGEGLTKEEQAEEKRKLLEEEFKKIKEVKESQQPEEPEPTEEPEETDNQDLAIAAEHAQKARAKWDKIQRKEAKKAQKASAVKGSKPGAKRCLIVRTPEPTFCVVCSSKVYQMEKLECDGRFYHRPCFKCTECGFLLRLESYAKAPNGCIYCRNHYKSLFNNMSRPLFDGRPRDALPG